MISSLTLGLMGFVLLLAGCSSPPKAPNLGGIYNHLAQLEAPYRNPVILIPDLLGSKLVDPDSEAIVWGAFGTGTLNPNRPDDARLFGLPTRPDKNLHELTDRVMSAGTLDRVVVNFGGYLVEQNAYAYILGVLGVGGYRDEQQHAAGLVDWGSDHFTNVAKGAVDRAYGRFSSIIPGLFRKSHDFDYFIDSIIHDNLLSKLGLTSKRTLYFKLFRTYYKIEIRVSGKARDV
jgi:hypothetical protein